MRGVGQLAEANGGGLIIGVVVFRVGHSGCQVFNGDLVPRVEELAPGDFKFDSEFVNVESEEDERDREAGGDPEQVGGNVANGPIDLACFFILGKDVDLKGEEAGHEGEGELPTVRW